MGLNKYFEYATSGICFLVHMGVPSGTLLILTNLIIITIIFD